MSDVGPMKKGVSLINLNNAQSSHSYALEHPSLSRRYYLTLASENRSDIAAVPGLVASLVQVKAVL